MVLFISTEEGI